MTESLRLSMWLASQGYFAEARHVCRKAEQVLPLGDERLRLTLRRVAIDLMESRVPEDLEATVLAGLAAADERFERRDDRGAAHLLSDVFAVAFHRTVHFDGEQSPLASDPDAFLAAFRASRAFTALTMTSQRARPPASATQVRRLLFVSLGNWNFIREIVEDYRVVEGLEVRTVDLKGLPAGPWGASSVELIYRRLLRSRGIGGGEPPPDVLEPFAWADVIFVEWGHRALVWTSLLPSLDARLITRIHSYEVFSPMPSITDWAAVDDVIFVAPAIRAIAESTAPGLTSVPGRHVIPNRNLLRQFDRPKGVGAKRTIALLGWNTVNKDPLWALDVLERLHEQDKAWRLALIGHDFPETGLTSSAASYRDLVWRRMSSMGTAVETVPFTDDVPTVLTSVGVILSTSRREGTHEGLIQGVASGSLPVVRDWPHLSHWGGPRALFPASWVVATPAEAASRIVEVTASADRFDEEVSACREFVMEKFDYPRVRPRLDELLLGRPLEGGSSLIEDQIG